MSKKHLVVIDGKSVFYRGYYAMPNLSTKDGTSTGGVYGFAVMALEVLKKMDPDYVCVAWDKSKTSTRRRKEIYPEYKANRKPPPKDFYEQIPVLKDLLDAFGWPFYEIDDHEADDIMGTFAVAAKEKGIRTTLISSDHDLLQLVNDDVTVAALRKGLTNVEFYDPKTFRERYHMTTDQFVDYKSLRGDPSDNLPGVPGVGEKTAIKLIDQFGSLDGIYQNLDQVKGSIHDKLKDNKDQAYLTKKLVLLDCDVDLTLDYDAADARDYDAEKVRKKLAELEFRSLIKQLPQSMAGDVSEFSEGFGGRAKIEHIHEKADLKKVKFSDTNLIQFYCQGEHGSDPLMVLVGSNKSNGQLIDLTREIKLSDFAELFAEQNHSYFAYDAKTQAKALMGCGVENPQIDHDIRMAAFLINPLVREQSLQAIAEDQLGYTGVDISEMTPQDFKHAAPELCALLWELKESQDNQLMKHPKLADLANTVEWPVMEVLAKMELRGIELDQDYLESMSKEFAEEIQDLEQEIYGYADQEFNIASPAQLSKILFEKLELPTQFIKKTKTAYSTAASELEKLKDVHPIIPLISKYREYTKLKSTYIDALPKLVKDDGRLHTTFSMAVAATGRLSSHDPNLQNIPVRTQLGRRIRRAFVAGKGNTFISADYSQFELRLAAEMAGDDDMIESFNEGEDIHVRTAAMLHGLPLEDVTKQQRSAAKAVNFGILYGLSPHGLSVQTGMDLKEAKEFIDKYFELRQPLLDFIEKTKSKAANEGYVETMFGRRRPTPDVHSSNFVVRNAAYRAAVNMPIQGTEADIMKMAMIEVENKLGAKCKQLLQVHDSILLECAEETSREVGGQLVDIMENIVNLKVNLDVDVSYGSNWGEL